MTAGFGFGFGFGEASPIPPPAGGWRIGVNVPWTVSWTGEQHFDLEISKDFPGTVDLTQRHSPGEGAPRFRALHVTRHRQAMVNLLCHVCGKPTHKRDRFLLPVQTGAMAILPDDTTRYAASVPPVHRACAALAASLCPHLRAHPAAPVAYPTEPSRLLPRLDVVAGMEALSNYFPPDFKIVYSCYRLFGPHFSAQAGLLRQAAGV